MFTKEQRTIIDYLCQIGYGWAKFAVSVENQGFCSEKQYETMQKMKMKIKSQRDHIRLLKYCSKQSKSKKRYNEYEVLGSIGCSDSEAIIMGEYF